MVDLRSMAFQGTILALENNAFKVVVSYAGTEHDVNLPPSTVGPSEMIYLIGQELAATVLQCLSSRARLEVQHALAASRVVHLDFHIPSLASELLGSFADVAHQLQECVHQTHEYLEYRPPAAASLLLAAAQLGHASAAQQLLLVDPRPEWQQDEIEDKPAFQAAESPHGASVLQLLLTADPERVQATCYSEPCWDWTLMHSAARGGNVEAIRLLLQLAPELAAARSTCQHTPLHEAAGSGCPEAVRLLLEAAPQSTAVADESLMLPLHWAAGHGSVECLRILLEAGAPGLDVPNITGQLALHSAAYSDDEATIRLLLAAHPGAALVEDSYGRRPLQVALHHVQFDGSPLVAVNAARALLPASGLSAQQLLGLLAAVPAQAQPLVQPLYAELAAHMPLSPAEWQQVPTPCPGLGDALPAVLERSGAEAALLVAHLPPAEAERLQLAALCLHRVQCTTPVDVPLPAALVGRMLALSLSDTS